MERALAESRQAARLMRANFTPRVLKPFSDQNQIPFLATDKEFMPLSGSAKLSDWSERQIVQLLGIKPDQLDYDIIDWGWAFQSPGNFNGVDFNTGDLAGGPKLEDFRRAWDFFHKAYPVTLDRDLQLPPPRLMHRGKDLLPEQRRGLASLVRSHPDTHVRSEKILLGLREDRDPNRLLAIRKWYIVVQFSGGTRFGADALPVDEIWLPINARKKVELEVQPLIIPFTADDHLVGSFNDNFADLSVYTKGLESLKLSEVTNFLDQRIKTESKEIQLFGIQIPQSAISQWGMLILIACQVYLALHVDRASEYWRDRTYPFPWIALYPNRGAQLTSAISVTALPMVTSMLLCWQGWEGSSSMVIRTALTLGTLVSIMLAVVTIRIWPRSAAVSKVPNSR